MTWEKLPAVEGSIACFTCGCGARSDLDPHRAIAVGFGDAGVTRDDETVWSEASSSAETFDDFWTVAMVEEMAQADPDHDWRIYFHAPLYEATYQRQGDGVWVLVSKGDGFA